MNHGGTRGVESSLGAELDVEVIGAIEEISVMSPLYVWMYVKYTDAVRAKVLALGRASVTKSDVSVGSTRYSGPWAVHCRATEPTNGDAGVAGPERPE